MYSSQCFKFIGCLIRSQPLKTALLTTWCISGCGKFFLLAQTFPVWASFRRTSLNFIIFPDREMWKCTLSQLFAEN